MGVWMLKPSDRMHRLWKVNFEYYAKLVIRAKDETETREVASAELSRRQLRRKVIERVPGKPLPVDLGSPWMDSRASSCERIDEGNPALLAIELEGVRPD